jgi:hypothetical protein
VDPSAFRSLFATSPFLASGIWLRKKNDVGRLLTSTRALLRLTTEIITRSPCRRRISRLVRTDPRLLPQADGEDELPRWQAQFDRHLEHGPLRDVD